MARTYSIPDNFIEGGRLFGGVIKTRNFIEAVILGGAGGLLSMMIPASSLQTRITIFMFLAAPGFLLGLFGVNNDPLSTFLLSAYKWHKAKKIMLYNGNAKGRNDDIVERMLAQKTPQEILAKKITDMKEKRSSELEYLLEGVDFVFEEDEELTKFSSSNASKGKTNSKKRFGKRKNDKSALGSSELSDALVNISDMLKDQD